MVNSGKTSAAEAARLFGLKRSSVSRLISQARAEGAAIVN
jgi:DNA-directed RNA polymerase specialized sigma24 family protein